MNRRQFLSGSLALAALAATPRFTTATPMTNEEIAMHLMWQLPDNAKAIHLMRFMYETWDPREATPLPVFWEETTYNGRSAFVRRTVEPTDPEWETMYWQWRIMRTLKLNGQLDYVAEIAPAEFGMWSSVAIKYVL